MILLFTACRSLKYPLSGNKTPCPFLYIGPIYRRGGKEKKKKKSSIKIEEEKKELLLQWSRKNQSLTRRITHDLQTKSSDPMAALQNPATRMISGENSRQICFELGSFTADRGFTVGHPADELLLYRIPMDEDDSWQLC